MNNTAQSYAAALYELSFAENKTERVLNDLSLVLSVFRAQSEYVKLLNSYALQKDEKDRLICEAFGSRIDKYSENFIKLMASKNILHLFFDCEKAYSKLYRKDNNIERASVVSAVEMTDGQKEKLIRKLENISKKKIEASFSVDLSLIGGFVVRFENSQLDLSVKSKLDDMKKHIFS